MLHNKPWIAIGTGKFPEIFVTNGLGADSFCHQTDPGDIIFPGQRENTACTPP